MANLFVNALQAMVQARSPDRRLTITVAPCEGGMVTFSVRDNGPGFRPDDAKRLFEHFFTTKDGGMGIGLTICQSIIRAHEGRIEAHNTEGGGAEFIFALPASTGGRRQLTGEDVLSGETLVSTR